MSRIKSFVLLAGAAMSISTGASLAQSSDAYRAELQADVQGRSSLLAAGASAQHNNGNFGFTDATGNNSLNFMGYGSFRWFFNFGDDDRFGGGDNDFAHGGQTADVQFITHGTVASKNFGYFVRFGASGTGGVVEEDESSDSESLGLGVDDMFFTWLFDDGSTYVRMGQGKPLQGMEQNTHEAYQQRLNRSLPGSLFGTMRTHFVAVGGSAGSVNWQVGFNDGAGTGGADFFSSSEADINVNGAVIFYFTGTAADFPGSAWNGAPNAVSQSAFKGGPEAFRGGLNASFETSGSTGIGTSEYDAWQVNGGLEYRNASGFSARGYGYISNVDPDSGTDRTDYAFSATLGYFVSNEVEIYGGGDLFFWDDDFTSEDNQNFIVVGANYFPFGGPAVRFTVEGIYSLDNSGDFLSNVGSVGASSGFSRFNILGDADDGEFGIGFGVSVVN
ncbi:MAG: hypothetical protein IT439_06490 [Phycisphaerales bacterium]|nr:hypothetical protein [Phycisphaerales bacterium]